MTIKMRLLAIGILLTTALLLGACGGQETCEEPEFYEYAASGKRIAVPEDLSDLAASRELSIPEASPRPPRPRDAGCLDRPPSLRVQRDGEEEE